MNRCRLSNVLVALLVGATLAIAQPAPSPFAGTWTLDVGASSSTGGLPAASTLTISDAGDTLRFEIVDTFDGRQQPAWSFLVGPEGRDTRVPVPSFIDSVSTTRRRDRTLAIVLKKEERVVSEMTAEVSADRTMLTMKSKATSPAGDTVSGTSVYRRGPAR